MPTVETTPSLAVPIKNYSVTINIFYSSDCMLIYMHAPPSIDVQCMDAVAFTVLVTPMVFASV